MKRRKRGIGMNLTIVKEKLLKLGESIGLKVHEETAEQLVLDTHMTAKNYFSSSVYLRLVVYQSGTLHLFLTFNELAQTYENLFAINAFNAENPWFRAYITNIHDRDYLEIHYTAVGLNHENEAIDTFGFLLNELLNEPTMKYLKPILNGEAD